MENRIVNKSKITLTDMYMGFVMKRQWFTVSYQILSLLFLLTLLFGIFNDHPDRYYRILVSTVFLILCLTVGFIYPLFRTLNWRNTLNRKSDEKYVECHYVFYDAYLKVSSDIANYNFKLNYSEVEKIRKTKRFMLLTTHDNRFVICKNDGFENSSDIDKTIEMIRRISKKA